MISPRELFSVVANPSQISSDFACDTVTIFLSSQHKLDQYYPDIATICRDFDFEKKGVYRTHIALQSYQIVHLDHMTDALYQSFARTTSPGCYDFRSVILDDAALGDLVVRCAMASYRFDFCKSSKEEQALPVFILDTSSLRFDHILAKISALTLARDLVNLPPNLKTPSLYQEIIESLPWKHTSLETLQDVELRQEGCGLITAVAAGGSDGARVMFFRSKNAQTSDRLIVGKGVVFDAGGLQIKPDSGMLDMKCDMAGSASVVAAFWYADLLSIDHSHVGAIGIVDNLLGPDAFKPLDVYTAKNGVTVEIHHTDAEGRLVLADVMALGIERYQPRSTLTIATLTGACIVALGSRYSGIMGSDEETISHMLSPTHEFALERYWRLPYGEYYHNKAKSTLADIQNITNGVKAGSTMGAAFLSHFCSDLPYTHMDIAGPAYLDSGLDVFSAGATGAGTEALISLMAN